jgi:hypothetical protein
MAEGAAVAALREYLHIVVNNDRIGAAGTVEVHDSDELWHRVLVVNVVGIARAAARPVTQRARALPQPHGCGLDAVILVGEQVSIPGSGRRLPCSSGAFPPSANGEQRTIFTPTPTSERQASTIAAKPRMAFASLSGASMAA